MTNMTAADHNLEIKNSRQIKKKKNMTQKEKKLQQKGNNKNDNEFY